MTGRTDRAVALRRLLNRWKLFLERPSLDSISAVKLGIFTQVPGYRYDVRAPLVTASLQLEGEAIALVNSLLSEYEAILSS